MTQDEIIRMATEVWGYSDWKGAPLERLERFAALVAEPWIETNKALAKEIIELKKQAEQEPVAYAAMINGEIAWDADYPFSNEPFTCFDDEQAVPLYAAPVRTKDLTDEEIMKINVDTAGIVPTCDRQFHFARAVIAADREKNK